MADKDIEIVGVVGAGAMGRGIVQIAAVAGVTVKLFDTAPAAIDAALAQIGQMLQKLAEKGRMSSVDADAAMARIHPAHALADLASCDAVVEAIVERLDVKRTLFASLEDIVADDCVLATNTSSLSVTDIAAKLRRPQRVAGFHFFNPVPLMRVVEVIDGARTEASVTDRLMALAKRMGHAGVRAKDSPGFIVNHAGRGFGTESLRILGEGVAPIADIDDILREQAGFKLGPFELLDLTGLDVSHAVMESIYHQFYEEPRFKPSPLGALRVAAGLFGRKTGEGFYVYPRPERVAAAAVVYPARGKVWVSAAHALGHARVCEYLADIGVSVQAGSMPDGDALIIVTPFGQDCTAAACDQGLDPARTVAVDCLMPLLKARRRTLMVNPLTRTEAAEAAAGLFTHDGAAVTRIRDSAGFVAQRVVALIVAIGCEIAQQQIARPADIDLAVGLGLNYPHGPLAWGDAVGPALVAEILQNLSNLTDDPRYRPGMWLKRRARLGCSLLLEEC